jgi:hypothetical protein
MPIDDIRPSLLPFASMKGNYTPKNLLIAVLDSAPLVACHKRSFSQIHH